MYHVEKPLEMSLRFSACIWANLWGSIEPAATEWPFAFTTGMIGDGHVCYPHHHVTHHFGSIHTFRIPASHHARLWSWGFSSSVECLCVASSPLGFTSSFFQPFIRRRHCCSSWRWREGEVPGVCCCLGLFEYGALGRGHWPTAAHPPGPPYDKPGNVEWRPKKGETVERLISGPASTTCCSSDTI